MGGCDTWETGLGIGDVDAVNHAVLRFPPCSAVVSALMSTRFLFIAAFLLLVLAKSGVCGGGGGGCGGGARLLFELLLPSSFSSVPSCSPCFLWRVRFA